MSERRKVLLRGGPLDGQSIDAPDGFTAVSAIVELKRTEDEIIWGEDPTGRYFRDDPVGAFEWRPS